jgi:hypothetical protein
MARRANQEDRDLHPDPTPSGYRYYFHPKHHGAGSSSDARWLPEMSRDEEFAVFVLADEHDLSDDKGDLYGLRIRGTVPAHEILFLGTRYEQVAHFWEASQGSPWHGYPVWPIIQRGSLNRKGQQHRPAKEVLQAMVGAGLLNLKQLYKFMKGDTV